MKDCLRTRFFSHWTALEASTRAQ